VESRQNFHNLLSKNIKFEIGSWSPWQTEGSCSRTCGAGVQQWRRECLPGDNSECQGMSEEMRECIVVDECPSGNCEIVIIYVYFILMHFHTI